MLAAGLSILAAFATGASADASVSITDFSASPVDFVYPPARGYAADTASVYPCGGIDPAAARTSYPLSGGELAVNASTLVANVNLLYSNETDPTLFHDFSTWTDSVLDMSVGEYCVSAPDFSAIDLAAGDNVTMLVIYQLYGNETYYYHCADLTLVDNSAYTAPTDVTCTNSSLVLDVATADNSLVLAGENFTADAAGADGQDISVASAPTTSATAEVSASFVSATSTAVSSGAAAAATSSAASAASSAASSTASSTSGAGLSVAHGSVFATGLGVVAIAISALL